MGGVGAWKQREKEQREWRTKLDREEIEAEIGRRREKKEEAGDSGEGDQYQYDEYGDLGAQECKEEESEEIKCDDDDVSSLFLANWKIEIGVMTVY